MKISISKDRLREAIAIVSKALSKIVIQVERGHLLFKTTGNTASISGTNNDLKSQCVVPLVECEQDVTFTADPKILDKLISKIDSDVIKMEFDSTNLTLKVYTSIDETSFNTLQTFPTDKMLTVGNVGKSLPVSHTVRRDVMLRSLKYAVKYLEALNEENKKFDFIIINKGVVFAANGLNKMGYFVVTDFKDVENIKIRKPAVPLFISVLDNITDETIVLGESDNDIVIKTESSSTFFSCLKSTVEAPKMDLNYLKREGAYVEVTRTELVKKLNRLGSTRATMIGAGIELTLSGAGDTAYVDVALLSNLKAKERVSCKRVNDTSSEDVKHILDYKLFMTSISSFIGESIILYISTPLPYFKIVEAIKEEPKDCKGPEDPKIIKYLTVGIGSYSKIRSKVA